VRPRSIVETVLYAPDLEAAAHFYTQVLGLEALGDIRETGFACRVAPGQVLLVFDPRESDKPGRSVPVHGARGPGHIALAIDEDDIEHWRRQLSAHGVTIEHEHTWGDSDGFAPAHSLYARDPAGNSVELITGDIWRDPAGPDA